MQTKPWVSFCMTTFKRPLLLNAQIITLSQQTFRDFEVIICDNDPDASARSIVESFQDNRFRYYHNEENLGMIRSFNKSITYASGEFIVMITDDDPVYPDMLKTLYELQEEFPGYGMYLGGCDWFCTSHEVGKLYNMNVGTNSCLSNEHDIGHKKVYKPGEFLEQLFSFGIFPHYLWSTGMVKREILVSMGGVPEYGTPFLGDYAYMSANASHSGCVIINRSLGCQTLHQENFGRNQNEQIEVAAKNFPAYIEQKVSHLPEWPSIKPRMLRFTALWVVYHMGFLYQYYKELGLDDKGLKEAEEAVFKIPYIKRFRTKYVIKKNFPTLHDSIVKMKKRLAR